ncbi:MAG: hypothetical protein M1118_05980 [Chloroflexi bacterium]|nr:hypothetical protein [Chloroflexota bacterium]
MVVNELLLLNDRYSVVRRLAGSDQAPLCLGTDLQRGKTVVIRLHQYTPGRRHISALPHLVAPPEETRDGALLPYDFGIDGNLVYVVRPYAGGRSLADLLTSTDLPPLVKMVTWLRRAAEITQRQYELGSLPRELTLDQIIISSDDTVAVAGYDHTLDPSTTVERAPQRALLRAILEIGAQLPPPMVSKPLAQLLNRAEHWLWSEPASLDDVIFALQRTERQLRGHAYVLQELGHAITTSASSVRALRSAGRLFQPYVLVGSLLALTVVITNTVLTGAVPPGRVIVLPFPTAAPVPVLLTLHPQPQELAASPHQYIPAVSAAAPAPTQAAAPAKPISKSTAPAPAQEHIIRPLIKVSSPPVRTVPQRSDARPALAARVHTTATVATVHVVTKSERATTARTAMTSTSVRATTKSTIQAVKGVAQRDTSTVHASVAPATATSTIHAVSTTTSMPHVTTTATTARR